MLCLGLMKTPNRNRSVLNGCRSVLGLFCVKFQSAFGLGLVLRNFCIKEIGVLGEMLSNIFKTHVFVLAITCPLLIQIWV